MSVIPVRRLCGIDLQHLGNNLMPEVRKDRRELQRIRKRVQGLPVRHRRSPHHRIPASA